MKRTTRLPDAINCDTGAPFYQVPFSLIDDKNLSGKAFKILVMSLRNKEGEWTSYLSAITERMKEGAEAVANGLKELEAAGYLRRVKYRNQQTKTIVGSVWLFTSTPHKFKTEKIQNLLQSHGYEPQFEWQVLDLETPTRETPNGETPIGGNHPLIILKDNNYIKENNMLCAEAAETTENHVKIRPEYFEMFWSMYPKRTQGKGSKGQTKTRWEALCRKPLQDRPRWRDVKVALHQQKKSIQWHDPNFIPLPTTWLNQQRWLDEATEYAQGAPMQWPKAEQVMPGERVLEQAHIDLWFMKRCYYPFLKILPGEATLVEGNIVAQHILDIRAWFRVEQKRPVIGMDDIGEEFTNLRLRWERIPDYFEFLEQYIRWLPEQNWLDGLTPSLLNPHGKVVTIFRQQLEKDIGFDLFTGRILT